MKTKILTSDLKVEIFLPLLIVLMCVVPSSILAQTATVSIPVGTGYTTCAGTTHRQMELNFNASTNTLSNGVNCLPTLGSPGYSSTAASVAFNPADGLLYYTRFTGSPTNSYIWRWDPRTCGPSTSPAPYQTYNNQVIAGFAFDPSGIGWQINFTGATAPFGLTLQKVDFATGTVGVQDNIILPAGVNIYSQTGDIVYSPSGQLFFAFNNKLFTVNHNNYQLSPLNATYIDTVELGAGMRLVGLAYSDGKLLASMRNSSGSSCFYREVNALTGDTSTITYSGTFSARDLTSVISGVGSSKRLVSATPTGTAGVYNLVYDIYVKNYGNVPDSNVQVSDNLAAIFGAANVSNVSTSWVGAAPSGFTLNSLYNGIATTNLLLPTNTAVSTTVNVLKNYPVAENSFTIRLSCRVSSIVAGVVYNNNAVVTATGYRAVALRDESTNGTQPDLNTNDKPDDVGENQPTPFVVSVAAETPACSVLSTVLYNQSFGTGAGLNSSLPGTVTSQYAGSSTQPIPAESYTLSNNANNGNTSRWVSMADHTGNANGRMLLVNADIQANKIFVDEVNVQCSNLKYSFFGYASFVGNSTYSNFCDAFGGFKFPKLIFTVRDATTGAIISNATTSSITSNGWTQYGMKFVMPTGVTRVILEIYNAGEGGCGNDLALDDIQFGLCDPQPVVSASAVTAGCLGSSTTFNASLTDTTGMGSTLVYQWQSSTNNVSWSDIASATNPSYSIASVVATDAKYYRIIVASAGNINNSSCRYISNSFFFNTKTASSAPTAALKNRIRICPTDAVQLSVSGGSLGTNAAWNWYSGSCGGTLIGTGSSITVNPSVTTTYFVRAVGDCNTTSCASVTVTVSCDIDDDDDGITDLTESGGVDPDNDHDSDGIPDYLDSGFAGFTDANTDGVNDNFDTDRDGIINSLDLDSDNDGIPDVVESYGVDTNGDGKIDNYTDTDADGFSQNVDGNNSGHLSSGNGLGLMDLDGDGVPNCYDLDSDNDGIPDVREAGGTDANNDGRIDGFTDTDADGFSNSVDGDVGNDGTAENAANSLLRTGPDGNSNGRADSYPYCNFDSDSRANPYDLDSDGDGITDVREAGFTDADSNGFSDGTKGADGWDDAIDALGTLTIRNSDGDSNLNYLDIDSDNDGVPDNVEGLSTSAYQFSLGVDSDGDGIDNRYDNVNGFTGSGITPNNQDADGQPDYIDTDTDNDGVLDIAEANDYNLNTLPDDNVTLTSVDADGDGLDNRFDANNSSRSGTSRYMGAGGSFSGHSTPGSNTMVQQSFSSFSDRDWRSTAFILDAYFLNFHGNRDNEKVNLRWVVTCNKVIEHFDIERSTNGTDYEKVAEVKGIGNICNSTPFNYKDEIAGIAGTRIYYRIKAVSAGNNSKRSQTILISRQAVSEILVSPNPATHYVNITCNAFRDDVTEVVIFDGAGKTVLRHQQKVYSGSNTFTVDGISRLAKGVYTIRVTAGVDIIRKKLVIKPQ